MANTTISIEFPEYKIKAIEQALEAKKEAKPVEQLLTDHLDGLYQKNVPIQARKYLDAQLGDGEPEAAKKPSGSRRGQKRSSSPQQENAFAVEMVGLTDGLIEQEEQQKEEPELTMSM